MFRMVSCHLSMTISVVVLFALGVPVANPQDLVVSKAPTGGVFVTPIPGVPFSAVAEQQMTQVLKDGTVFRRRAAAFIARDSRGRIPNENREPLPVSSNREPTLLSVHIYDSETRLNTFLNPSTRIARQRVLPNPPATAPPENWAQRSGTKPLSPNLQDEDLGAGSIEGIDVHGYRRTITFPESMSDTGRPLMVKEEYWYSEDLHINIVTKRNDPRFGELTIVVKQIDRSEPAGNLFEIPAGYKVVDVTPPEAESQDLP
jgi:hypothetical protein